MSIPTLDELFDTPVSSGFGDPLPIGFYNGVITGAEVKSGPKGPYIKVEVTIHDEDYRGRKTWKNAVSFSEKATFMPGGPAELLQATEPDIDRSLPSNQIPAAIAAAILSTPISVEVEHEQVKRNGVAQFNADGTPEMRAQIRSFAKADSDFITTVENEAAGLDDDLPF